MMPSTRCEPRWPLPVGSRAHPHPRSPWDRAEASGRPRTLGRVERTPLQDAVDGWLADGPLSIEELADRAVTAGLVPGEVDDEGVGPVEAIEELVQWSDAYWTTNPDADDDRVVLIETIVDTGMTFTHRVTEEELEAESVDLAPDLSVLDWNCRDGRPLDDGSGSVGADFVASGDTRLSGPLGWIEAVKPGDILRFTRTGGVLSVDVIDEDELGDGSKEIAALAVAAGRWIGGGQGEEEVPVLMEAMARDSSLFRSAVPPVGELLVAAGLERRGHEWGWAHEEWQTRQERAQGDDAVIRRRFGFDRCCDRAYDRVGELYRAYFRDGEIDGRALAEHLGHGSVAPAFVHAHAAAARVVEQFAAAGVDAADARHSAPALTLLGLARLRQADAAGAHEALEAAVRADPDLPAALHPLALLELDRGELARANTLAVRAEVDPGLIEWIAGERARQSALRPTAGRNDPCPCGSGKKFKRCCIEGSPLTLAQRVPFILQRMAHYAIGVESYETLFGLALSAAGRHDDVTEALRGFLRDPFVVDIAVHEGGLGEQYAEERGLLLAAGEAALLEAVLDAPRRLWEVTTISPGESVGLRDTGSGDEVVVRDRAASEGLEPGELLLARVAPVEDEALLFGVPLLVTLRHRDRVLRLLDRGWVEADSLAMWYGSLSLPPRMANREGDELVLRRTVCQIDDADAVVAALDGTYERQDDDDLVWHEVIEIDGEHLIRGTLRLDRSLLTVESNSEERQVRLLDTLGGLFDLEIVEDRDLDEDDLDLGTNGPLDLDGMPEEIRLLVEQNIADYEQRWVDEPVPALADLTPRQALDDPTRREDLLALLREMRTHELPEGAVGMSVDRLEQLLGINAG